MKDERLKEFMRNHFDFSSLKKAGVFPKEMKFNDYEEQAKVICYLFSLDSVYEYAFIGVGCRVHISYVNPTPFTPFIETITPLMKVEGKTAKIISLTGTELPVKQKV